MQDTPINHAAVKVASAVGVFATIDLWTTLGKVCAATYSILILAEWVWKRVIKPVAIKRGWIKPPAKNVIIQSEDL